MNDFIRVNPVPRACLNFLNLSAAALLLTDVLINDHSLGGVIFYLFFGLLNLFYGVYDSLRISRLDPDFKCYGPAGDCEDRVQMRGLGLSAAIMIPAAVAYAWYENTTLLLMCLTALVVWFVVLIRVHQRVGEI